MNLSNSKVINHLISSLGYVSYLELGLGNFETFTSVRCARKVGVDVDFQKSSYPSLPHENIVISSTTQFLLSCKETFDLIFIDADHRRDAVLSDAVHSAMILNPGGVLCFHDVGPMREIDTLETASGSAYKAWINIRNGQFLGDVYCCSFEENENVVGILCRSTKAFANPLQENLEESWESYAVNKSKILNSLSEQDLIKSLNLCRV